MTRSFLRSSVLGVLLVAAACSDIVSPTRNLPSPADARKDIDISVATIALDVIYNGQSIGTNFGPPGTPIIQGDRCFILTIDGVQRITSNVCGTTTIADLAPGAHIVGLQYFVQDPSNPPALGHYVDVQPPVSVNLVGGQSTPLAFDISGVRGKVTGTVRVNGQPAPDNQYSICLENITCTFLVGGQYTMFARAGTGAAYVQSNVGFSRIIDIPYTVMAGQTTDVGPVNVQFGTIALDVLYNGQSIGQNFGPPGTSIIQGDRCFILNVDGQQRITSNVCGTSTIPDLAPGTHTVSLQYFVQDASPPALGHYVDVQPPATVTVVGGQSVPLAIDISGARGKVTGTVRVNGFPAPDNQYSICLENSACSFLVGGQYTLFAKAGAARVYLQSNVGFSRIADVTVNVVAGQTADAGALTVQFGTVALDILYNGQSIGSNSPPPGVAIAQGDRCFTLTVDGVQRITTNVCGTTSIPDLSPGPHTIGLQYFVQDPTVVPALGHYVDVQPPLSITVVGGQSTPAVFDISAARGKIAGGVRINGQPAPDNQYSVCFDNSGCSFLTGGQFTLFARTGSGKAYLQSNIGFTRLAEFSFIVAGGKTTLIGGVSTAAPGSTPSGSNVSIQPVNQTDGSSNSTVGLTFANVSTPGTTTVFQTATGAPVPTGLQLGTPPVYFNISSTATFTGSVDVCINYTGTTFPDPTQARLLHGDGAGNWTDVTTTHDQVNRIICGSVTSFSPFVVAQRTAAAPPPAQKPTVTAHVSGTQMTGGWYVTNVSVTWTIVDNGSAVTTKTGCDQADITTNTSTAGTVITCSATSAGGTTTSSVTILRDANKPIVTPSVVGTPGAGGWYTSDATVSWAVTNAGPSGATAVCNPTTQSTDIASRTISCTATSGAGLTGDGSITIKRDATVPGVSVALAGTAGANDWYTSDVGISATATNLSLSGGSAACTPTNVTADAAAVSYTCIATSGAGLTATKAGTIKRDATRPMVSFTSHASAYTVDQTIAINCSRSDATSGIQSATCPSVNAGAYTFALGSTTLNAQATDNAGLTATATTVFTVTLTGPSFAALIPKLVPDAKAQKTLLGRLDNILDKLAKGNTQSMSEQVKNFLKELDKAVEDGGVTGANAAILAGLVQKF